MTRAPPAHLVAADGSSSSSSGHEDQAVPEFNAQGLCRPATAARRVLAFEDSVLRARSTEQLRRSLTPDPAQRSALLQRERSLTCRKEPADAQLALLGRKFLDRREVHSPTHVQQLQQSQQQQQERLGHKYLDRVAVGLRRGEGRDQGQSLRHSDQHIPFHRFLLQHERLQSNPQKHPASAHPSPQLHRRPPPWQPAASGQARDIAVDLPGAAGTSFEAQLQLRSQSRKLQQQVWDLQQSLDASHGQVHGLQDEKAALQAQLRGMQEQTQAAKRQTQEEGQELRQRVSGGWGICCIPTALGVQWCPDFVAWQSPRAAVLQLCNN